MTEKKFEADDLQSLPTAELIKELTRRNARTDAPLERGEPSGLAHAMRTVEDEAIVNTVRSQLRAIYGADNRTDYNDLLKQVQNADAVVLVVHKNSLTPNSDGSFTLATARYGDQVVDDEHFKGLKLCPSERFIDQPSVRALSGVLIAEDIIATAGHVIMPDGLIEDASQVGDLRVIFGFRSQDGTQPVIVKKADHFIAKEFIAHLNTDAEDWALIRLSSKVSEERKKTIPKIRIDGKIADVQEIYMIGHPRGLPQKLSYDGRVEGNSAATFFTSKLDAFHGNSGSPVFNSSTHIVEGIIVHSAPETWNDFAEKGGCLISASYANGYSKYARTTAFSFYLTKGQFYTTDGKGNMSLLKQHGTLSSGWSLIVAGEKFADNAYTDLFFFDYKAGLGAFYSTDSKGGLQKLSKVDQADWWFTKWTHILPGKFWANEFTGLFCYDSELGQASFFSTDGKGGVTNRGTIAAPKGCTMVVPGKFSNSTYTDLVFYDPATGNGKIFSCVLDAATQSMKLKEIKTLQWLKTWSLIVPGLFDNSGYTGLLFYDRSNGKVWVYSWNGSSLTSLLENQDWGTSWTHIIPGIFGPTKAGSLADTTDLLFYSEKSGEACFYTTNYTPQKAGAAKKPFSFNELKKSTGWRKAWSILVPGHFTAGTYTDLLLYCPTAPL